MSKCVRCAVCTVQAYIFFLLSVVQCKSFTFDQIFLDRINVNKVDNAFDVFTLFINDISHAFAFLCLHVLYI